MNLQDNDALVGKDKIEGVVEQSNGEEIDGG